METGIFEKKIEVPEQILKNIMQNLNNIKEEFRILTPISKQETAAANQIRTNLLSAREFVSRYMQEETA